MSIKDLICREIETGDQIAYAVRVVNSAVLNAYVVTDICNGKLKAKPLVWGTAWGAKPNAADGDARTSTLHMPANRAVITKKWNEA